MTDETIRLLDDGDELLKDEETAALLGINVRTLWRWDAIGDSPPAIMLGRVRYRRLRAVRAWVLNRETVSA